ncbi:MAG: SURF1 family protein [Alphaproteobacteria bacterium]|nr:SURF1 family protein [Alphaproteobacteria bacterium]
MKSRTRIWPILLAAALGFMLLLGLGIWQVKRLDQKTKLISALTERMSAPAVTLDDALAKKRAGEDPEYLKVHLSGSIDYSRALRKVTSFNGAPGWEVIAPIKLLDGRTVMVDLGAIGIDSAISPIAATTAFDGVIRSHDKGRGFFDNDNDAKANIWFWWDLPRMAEATGATPDMVWIVQRLPAPGQNGPEAQAPKVELSNNHLGYAITWFGLAAALLGVTGFYIRSLKKTDA